MKNETKALPEVILVYYINVGGISHSEANKVASEVMKGIDQNCRPYKGILNIVMPVREGESRVECVSPMFVGEDKYNRITFLAEEFEEILLENIKIWKNKLKNK